MTKIKIRTPVITLGQLLKFTSEIDHGAMAKDFLTTHAVMVNGILERRRGRKLYVGDRIQIDQFEFEIEVENEQL